jgi:ABC-2 type transport system ATP-binding protein
MYMTGGMPAIEITDLTKSFNGLRAVDRLNLSIDKGQIFGLLGPNGAGKTTTIRMLTGLLKPDNGTIRVLSMENWEWKKIVGYIPEEAKLYEHLTVYEHLYFVGKLRGVEDLDNRVDSLLEFMELKDKSDEIVSTLSRGMKQKVTVACGVVHDPKVLIGDEPLMGLDPKSQRKVKRLMRSCADRGDLVLVSTHILDVAERFCDQIAIINKGKILAKGNLEDLKERSRSEKGATLEDVFLNLTEGLNPTEGKT